MNYRRGLLLALLAIGFFLSAAWLARPVDGVWNSPDEAANAFWAQRAATGESLTLADDAVGFGAGAIHPRSMGVAAGSLVPGSFPGLILIFGAFKRILMLPFHLVTPLFTAMAGALFAALVSRLFDRRVGFWAGALFFTHPAVLYYAARGLYHNELCLDLLIAAAACFVLRPFKNRVGRDGRVSDALGGFLFAWAMVTRASEAVWAVPAFLAFLPFIKQDRWRRVGDALIGAALPTFVFLFVNASLYGSPFRTAYALPPAVSAVVTSAEPAAHVAAPAASPVLPFGFHPRLVVTEFRNYGLMLFWWQTLLAAAGFAWWAARWRKTTGPQRAYAGAALFTGAWLMIFYGSWMIMDRFDPTVVTIGTSYVRYFLPAYVAVLPFAALLLTRAADAVRKPWLPVTVVVLCAFLSVRLAVYAGDESLSAVRLTLEGNAEKKTTLLAAIPSEAVVMTERFDKLLMPERVRIIPTIDDAGFTAAATAVAHGVPVYWYGLTPSTPELEGFSAAAKRNGLILGEPTSPVLGETLYPLIRP